MVVIVVKFCRKRVNAPTNVTVRTTLHDVKMTYCKERNMKNNLVCHGTDKLCTQTLEILINLCVTRSYHVHASLPTFRPHGLIVLSHDQVCCTQSNMHVLWRLALSCTVDFPPSTTATNIHLHPDYSILLILCLLGLFYLDMLHTL